MIGDGESFKATRSFVSNYLKSFLLRAYLSHLLLFHLKNKNHAFVLLWRQERPLHRLPRSQSVRTNPNPRNSTSFILSLTYSNCLLMSLTGNCQVTVEANNFSCQSDPNSLQISLSRSAKVTISGVILPYPIQEGYGFLKY